MVESSPLQPAGLSPNKTSIAANCSDSRTELRRHKVKNGGVHDLAKDFHSELTAARPGDTNARTVDEQTFR
jgi:hypothetical protein